MRVVLFLKIVAVIGVIGAGGCLIEASYLNHSKIAEQNKKSHPVPTVIVRDKFTASRTVLQAYTIQSNEMIVGEVGRVDQLSPSIQMVTVKPRDGGEYVCLSGSAQITTGSNVILMELLPRIWSHDRILVAMPKN
jgi:hypothetical protein